MRLKYLYLILAFILQFCLVWRLSLLAEPYAMIAAYLAITIIGLLISNNNGLSVGVRELGWGITFGSVTLFLLILVLFLMLCLSAFIEEIYGTP
jgi:hypothetical protein